MDLFKNIKTLKKTKKKTFANLSIILCIIEVTDLLNIKKEMLNLMEVRFLWGLEIFLSGY